MRKKGKQPDEEALRSYTTTFMVNADTDRNDKIDRDEFYRYYKAK